jgi:WD40 repeat protein
MILWDVATGQIVRRYEGHKGNVTAVAFSPDGQSLLSGSADATVRVWRNDSLEELQAWIDTNRYLPILSCDQRLTYGLACDDVNGMNATRVDFAYFNATLFAGIYYQTSDGLWTEQSWYGSVSYEEIGRDEWSVYLYDSSNDVYIQLDLFQETIYQKFGSDEPYELYTILNSYAE